MRKNAMAKSISENNSRDLWKEVNKVRSKSNTGSQQGWGQVQLTKYSSTPSTPNIYQVQVLVKHSFF